MRVKVTISAGALWRFVVAPLTRWLDDRRARQAARDRDRAAQLVAEMEAIKNAEIVYSDPAADELHRLRHPEAFVSEK